jgi:flagellar hook-length control protein FliK
LKGGERMNAIGMLIQPTLPTGEMSTNPQKVATDTTEGSKGELFSKLLTQLGNQNEIFLQNNQNLLDTSIESEKAEVSLIDLLKSLNIDVEHFLSSEKDLLSSEKELMSSENELISTDSEDGLITLDALEFLLGINQEDNIDLPVDNLSKTITVENEVPVQIDQEEYVKLGQQLAVLVAKFENLLASVQSPDDVKKIAPKVLELLQQWASVEQKLLSMNNTANQATENGATNVKVNQVWNDVLLAYQNRSKLTSKQQYQRDAQVTTKDVVKWIENALKNQQVSDKPVQSGEVNFQSNGVMHKLEQYVIYVNPNQNSNTVDKQLMDQFQQVIKTSKFLTMPNGTNQMSIALRPENLGEMMVRLTEVNGEMTVKIVVATQAAKEMLESNIHQLKHMFSPQQVIIERQDATGGQAQDQSKENSDQSSLLDQRENQSNQSSHQENASNGEDFEAQLSELMFEKV